MRSQWKRLGLAAGISLACASATLLWYYGTGKKVSGNGEAVLAQVSKVGDEVLRRPATRLLWQQVNTGDNLYNGETIRTSSRGELRIQFEDGRYIDLEPDSLIVLQKSKGEISLDLMEGSLFVNAKNDAAGAANAAASPGLVLNSKNGKVDLSGASASLSKGSGDRVDLQVLEGKAKVRGADGREKEVGSGVNSSIGAGGINFDSSSVTVLSPAANKPFFIDPDQEKPILFKWRGFPAQWKVSVQAGPTRKELRDIATTAKPGETEVATSLPLGKYWWKLVAKDPANNQIKAESPVSRVDIQARYAPTVIFPTANLDIPVEKSPFDLTFKWQRSEDTTRVQLEISSDPNMKTTLVNRAFSKEDQLVVPGLKEGIYYWRMSAFYEGSERPVSGKIQRFSIQKLSAMKKDPAEIAWTVPEDRLNQPFVQSPSLELSWDAKSRQDEIAEYRLKIANEGEPTMEPVQLAAKEPRVKATLPKAGRYVASIEAMDKNGLSIGVSKPLQVAVSELPLLKSPTLLPAQGTLESGFDGRTELRWENVEGAKEYRLTISDRTGRELAKKQYQTTTANLKNLMPGEYTVKLEAVDAFGRASEAPVPRTLRVPDKSNLRAPAMKRIQVN